MESDPSMNIWAAAVGPRPPGTAYGYHVDAHFSAQNAEGHRVEG
jgi:hypothetical protein